MQRGDSLVEPSREEGAEQFEDAEKDMSRKLSSFAMLLWQCSDGLKMLESSSKLPGVDVPTNDEALLTS